MTDLDQARDSLEDILNDREYQIYYEDNRNFLERWWDSVMEWVQELLSSLFQSIEPSNGFATGVVIIMAIIVIGLIIVAVGFIIKYYRGKYRYHDQTPLYHKHERDWTYREHLSEAKGLEDNGNLQLATRHLFLALLLYHHEKRFLVARIWKTNWEYYAELKQLDKERAEHFYQLARVFDDVVYGERPVELESYITFKDAVMYWMNEPNQKEKEG